MNALGKAMLRHWLLSALAVGLAGLVGLAACSQQQRRRVLLALIDGYPGEETDAKQQPGRPEGTPAPAVDRLVAASADATGESTESIRRISANHVNFVTDCRMCHGLGMLVTDDRCQECHEIGLTIRLHKVDEMDLTCGRCHTEHRGLETNLTAVPIERCAECHEEWPFEEEHPEFRLADSADAAREAKRATGLEVFHSTHTGYMECSQCHRPTGGETPAFEPVTFAGVCAECHDPEEHDEVPPTNWADLRGKLPPDGITDVLLTDARWSRRAETLKGKPELAAMREVREALADDGLEECFRCHSFVERETGSTHVLAVPPTRYQSDWFPFVRFRHGAHQKMACTDCHKVPEDSKVEIGRLILPTRDTCTECHNEDGAPTSCATCHLFHDREQ